MAEVVRVRQKGQVTLPLEVRRQLRLQEGDLLEASVENGRIVLQPVVYRRVTSVPVQASSLDGLVGLVALGGDAVTDAARYEE